MERTLQLKKELYNKPEGSAYAWYINKARGYRRATEQPRTMARAEAIYDLFALGTPRIYRNDLIVDSLAAHCIVTTQEELDEAMALVRKYPERDFFSNSDHYSPAYAQFLQYGLCGTSDRIHQSITAHEGDTQKTEYLKAMLRTLEGFAKMVENYLALARSLQTQPDYHAEDLAFICDNLETILREPPKTFAQALQLVWLVHTAFLMENRYAMALGRMDQYLYPYYQRDIAAGILTPARAQEMLENIFMKIHERFAFYKGDDVVNIAIGGTAPDGTCQVNDLSYLVLWAVGACQVPGPNLSARITSHTPDYFLDECLKVIGTGLGYPALMNDEINMAALSQFPYSHEDVCNYTMVGCIENFMTGKQPPWTDGRFDSPKYLEYLLNNGQAIYGDGNGINTGSVESITTMDEFMNRYTLQLQEGLRRYVDAFNERSIQFNPEEYVQPFLSIFCEDCIGRGLDICNGGAVYPSVHGIAAMGVGTVADSLAAVERVIFEDKKANLSQLAEALKANFEGFEELQRELLDAPKYGNNDDFVDKYAVWFVQFMCNEATKYHTHDGGYYYIGMAANTSNINSGRCTSATPDGRLAGTPISDAASPTFGRDTHGPTTSVNSLTKPDYSHVACGTVVNQKFSPAMFNEEKRSKLLSLIKVYFHKGGQEMQINATSREVLKAAMAHPEDYGDLVVRVSGFSALFVNLHPSVQEDILARTQQD